MECKKAPRTLISQIRPKPSQPLLGQFEHVIVLADCETQVVLGQICTFGLVEIYFSNQV